MKQLKLIVEGISDEKFLKDFISYKFPETSVKYEFIIAKGNLLSHSANSIRRNSIEGGTNILIFDSDKSIENSEKRTSQEIEVLKLDVTDQFYFPNNSDTGNLETLLRSVINNEREGVFSCIENYSDCLKEHESKSLRVFDEKSKVYIYVDSFVVGGSGDEKGRDYQEALLWNLKAPSLVPLKEFLSKYFL